jgi:hypothetical protein
MNNFQATVFVYPSLFTLKYAANPPKMRRIGGLRGGIVKENCDERKRKE